MDTLITIIVFIAGFITGILAARNNVKKVNEIVEDAEDFAARVNRKIDDLRDDVAKAIKPAKRESAKRGRPATKK